MNEIFMYWFKMPNGEKNFGDEVGPYIVSKILDSKINFVNPRRNFLIKSLFQKRKRDGLKIKDVLCILFGQKHVLVSAGSVLNHYNINSINVWGAGIITKKDRVKNANFLAVRGKYSQERLRELKYKVPKVIGDPALLLSLIKPLSVKKKYKLGIIPHYVHYKEVKKLIDSPDILTIDLLEPRIEKVLEDFNSCEMTISSSLHGLIVSHAYGIPSLWYELDNKPLYGDNIKFKDYFSSVGISDYEAFKLTLNENNYIDLNKIIENIKTNTRINSIQVDLKNIQKNLLSVAPFELNEKFKIEMNL